MNIQWIVAPLVGCVIGYITNAIAILMLFRPHNAVKIGRFTLPFTPGLIPRSRGRLAAAIGDVISRDLLNQQVLEETLLSGEMHEKLTTAIDRGFDSLRENEHTLGDIAAQHLGGDALDEWISHTQGTLTAMMHDKLVDADLGSIASKAIAEYALKKTPSALSGLVGLLVDDNRRHSVTAQLREGVNRYVADHGPEMIGGALQQGTAQLRDTRLCDLAEKYEDKLPEVKEKLIAGYEALIRSGLSRTLEAVDIAGIVRTRIESFDSRTLEKLVLSIMNRELNAIVWLGALLGFLMGFTNLLFQ